MSVSMNLMIKSDRLYDTIKFLAQILLPALGTLYFSLSDVWGLPNSEQVVGTIVALDAFLGVILGASTYTYNRSEAKYDGVIEMIEEDGSTVFNLSLDGDPYDLVAGEDVVFKVSDKYRS